MQLTRFYYFASFAVLLLMVDAADGLSQIPYRQPPKVVSDVLSVPPPPSVSLNPTRDTILLVQSDRYPPIAELAEPFLRLAGLRINPNTNGPAREPSVSGLSLRTVAGGDARPIEIPKGVRLNYPEWSPDGQRFAVLLSHRTHIELAVATVKNATLVVIPNLRVNGAYGDAIRWMPDGESLLVRMIPANRGEPPVRPLAPLGPIVQESDGKAAPVRTFQDMLRDAHDEDLFDYYTGSQLAIVNTLTGHHEPIGKPGVYSFAAPSPDGRFLLVSRVRKPYSYLLPSSAFPRTIEVWDRSGKVVHTVATLPLQDQVPIEGVPTGPRQVQWHPTHDAKLIWAEARDGGDPKVKVPHRDELFTLAAPFTEKPSPLFRTEHRYAGISYFPDGDRVLVWDYDRDRRWSRALLRKLSKPDDDAQVIFDRSVQDRYNDPGSPLSRRLPNGRSALWVVNDSLFLSGSGATPKGEFPFVDRFDLNTRKSERLFHCSESAYETATLLSDDGKKWLVRRETPTEPGNYFFRDGEKESRLTANTDPFPELRKAKKTLVTTKRPDGVTISFTLYLPPDYKDGEKRPTVFYAYPREFNTADTAGQVSGSPNRFTTIGGYSHLFFLTQGYVVMDEVSMPIVGPPETANDTFREQLVANAKAALDKAEELGVIDRHRVGVLGHSYGAFMTANLLAHSDLFRAGIARSGAYNRTLTPFGFQNERRTFWEAPHIYATMSPFNSAEKIKKPILLIHGAADDNSGTFPMQSERLYQAIRGNGGTVRLVMLPHESHGYAARESVEHVVAEQIAWFEKYVK